MNFRNSQPIFGRFSELVAFFIAFRISNVSDFPIACWPIKIVRRFFEGANKNALKLKTALKNIGG